VLITARKSQWTQTADVKLTWADVYNWLSSTNAPRVALLDELLEYLQAEGLGPAAPVSHESILSFGPGEQLLPALTTLFKRLANEIRVPDLPKELKSILRLPDAAMQPLMFEDNWGRIGLTFPNGLGSWRHGLFAGVLYHTQDHLRRGRYEYTVPHAGPDFDLILDFNTDDGSPSWTDYVGSPEFDQLRSRVRNDRHGYEVFDILHDRQAKEQNRWHPLHLRRPLLDVLRGTASVDEQASAMTREIHTAIEVILRGGELLALTNRILAKKGD
jgi:hypothetical protein